MCEKTVENLNLFWRRVTANSLVW